MLFRVTLVALTLLAVAGCTAPDPLTDSELREAALAEDEKWQARLAQLGEPVDLAWALTWALEHNLDFRLRAYDAALATGNRRLASMAMLPSLTAKAGYRDRSNLQASVSRSVSTGNVSLEPSTSSDRQSETAELEMSWNLLDFSLAFLRAREHGEQALIASEEQRRAVTLLVREVVHAWDKAAAHEALRPLLDDARELALQALSQSDRIVAMRLRDPLEVMEYRKALLLSLRRINDLAAEMDRSRDELARLLALPAGVKLNLAVGEQDFSAYFLSDEVFRQASLADWQYLALLSRPEMHQALYQARSARRSATRRMLEQMPSLMLRYGSNYDSNSYLVNSSWNEGAANLSFNLVSLANIPNQRRMGKLERQQAAARQEIQAAAITAQVSIVSKMVRNSHDNFCLSKALSDLEAGRMRLLDARAQSAALDQLSLVRNRLEQLLLQIEHINMHAELRQSLLMFAGTLGVPVLPADLEDASFEERRERIAAWFNGAMQSWLAEQVSLVAEEDNWQAANVDGPALGAFWECKY